MRRKNTFVMPTTPNVSVFKALDRLVYEPVRYLILEKLWSAGEVDFAFLRDGIRQEINLTDGNLAGHLLRLENAKYIKAKRRYQSRKPTTVYSITSKGKESFKWFLIGIAERVAKTAEVVGVEMPLSNQSA